MLYSQSHKVIFIHIAKNGGTSIRSHLAPIAVERRPRNWWVDLVSEVPIKRDPRKISQPPHVTANWVRTRLGAEIFDDAFSFAIVRNPFDQMVSRYEFARLKRQKGHYKRAKPMNFYDFIRRLKRTDWTFGTTQHAKISNRSGRQLVSKVYRFENSNGILTDVCRQIGIEPPTEVPHANASIRGPYQDYYTPESRQYIEKMFRKDLDEFGYVFR